MTDKNLFAPPTKEELAKAKAQASEGDMFAPPTKEEIANIRPRPKTSAGESALAGAAQFGSFGYVDEAVAGLGAAKDWAAGKLGLRGDIGFKDAYQSYIKPTRAKFDAAQMDNPGAYLGGGLVGGAATSLIPGVGFAKGASVLANVAKASALGGVAAGGLSTANPLESYDKAKEFGGDVLKGAATGAAVQGAFSVVGKGLSALRPENLKAAANKKALQAAGYLGSDMKKMGPQEIQRVGGVLREKGIVKAFDSLEDVLTKVETAKSEAGAQIGAALGKVDDLVTEAKGMVDAGAFGKMPEAAKAGLKKQIDKQFQFNMQKIGDSIEEAILTPNKKLTVNGASEFTPELAAELQKLQVVADNFRRFVPSSLTSGGQTKAALGKQIKFDSDSIPQVFKKEVYDIVKKELDTIVGRTGTLEKAVAKASGNVLGSGSAEAANKGASALYSTAKGTYGALKQVEDVTSKRIGSAAGNRTISLTDTIAGATGMATGGPVSAIALGGLNKLVRKYGDSLASVSLGKLADVIDKTPGALGKYYNIIAASADKGAPSLAATHRALMGEPNYRAILENFEKTQAIGRRIGDKKKETKSRQAE
jgi:hypothetical protein